MRHKCLTCDGEITEGQDEELVPGKSSNDRYRHTNYKDCQHDLSERHPLSTALHADRIRQRKGHVANLPVLEDMEEWGT